MTSDSAFIHPTAEVSAKARVGAGTRVWNQAQVREGAVIGTNCILGKGVYIDKDVRIGNNCKLQNGVFVFRGFDLEDGVFLGPGVMLLNDKHPRAINPDGSPKDESDWVVSQGTVRYGAAVGGGAVVLPGINIGRMALVGSGAVVSHDVVDRGVVYGNPARLHGFACDCGHKLTKHGVSHFVCPNCAREYDIPAAEPSELDAGISR
ncbi:MAG TPA: acyltransferase [Candidatus Dormibacteraeota bacterium]